MIKLKAKTKKKVIETEENWQCRTSSNKIQIRVSIFYLNNKKVKQPMEENEDIQEMKT